MIATKRIGVAIAERNADNALKRIQEVERMGIPAAWMTMGGAGGLDPLTVFASAATQTENILLGTAIIPSWTRHPIVMAQQAQVMAQLAPGRFRLGVGPSHKATMERTYGVEFHRPLVHLREYLHILKTLLHEGAIDYDGRYYHARTRLASPVDMPIMASALRRGSFEFCGADTDGAISWVCPGVYLRDVALPAMGSGAQGAQRPVPPLIAHAPVCVHENKDEVNAAVREQMGTYPRTTFYAQMFTDAGFPEVAEGTWSDAMVEAVVTSGNEVAVEERLREWLSFGATELMVTPILVGEDREASLQRTLKLVARLAQSI